MNEAMASRTTTKLHSNLPLRDGVQLSQHVGIMSLIQRKQATLLGALVADAASLGYHWLYDAARLATAAGDKPEFAEPDAELYEGAGYFAHGKKPVGALTHYGEQFAVALRAMAANGGDWNVHAYLAELVATFERGGTFAGYIDAVIRGTLNNVQKFEQELKRDARESHSALGDDAFEKTWSLVGEHLKHADPGACSSAIEEAICARFDDDATRTKAQKLADSLVAQRRTPLGADDRQIPAFSKLPPIVARYAGEAELGERLDEAIRATNNNDEAVAYATYAARALEQVILGGAIADALRDALSHTGGEARERIESALAFEAREPAMIGEHFGRACYASMAVPVSVAILRDATSYAHGVRQNILAAGDNAGRSLFVGSMLGAAHGIGDRGVPLSWMARLTELPRLLALIARVCASGESG